MQLMKRRKFLGLILTVAAGSVAYKRFYLDDFSASGVDVGTYLRNNALQLKGVSFESPSLNQLEQLEASLIARDWHDVDNEVAFYNRLQEIIRGDFLQGKIVEMDGWIISEFERDMIIFSLLMKSKKGISISDDTGTFETAKSIDFLKVKDWAPRSTCVGMGFNQQSDGHSSHWFAIDSYNGRLAIYIGDTAIRTTKGTDVLTTKIEGEILSSMTRSPGSLDVLVYDPARNLKQKIGVFEVYSRSNPATNENNQRSEIFGEIEGWGPKSMTLVELLGNDKTPLWIKTRCAPKDTAIFIGESPLDTTVSSTLVTSVFSVHQQKIKAASYPVFLYSRQYNEKVKVGAIEITSNLPDLPSN